MDATIVASWKGGLRFDNRSAHGPPIHIDCEGATGPGPIEMLLSALAACAASDVVLILNKQRTPPTALEIEVSATRVDGTPRRLKSVTLTWRVAGSGLTQESVERAVALSLDKYCSVRESLNKLIDIDWAIELEVNS